MDLVPVQDELNDIAESLAPLHLDWLSVAIALAIMVVALVLGRLARRAIRRVGAELDVGAPGTFDMAARLTSYAIGVVGLVVAMRSIGVDLGPVIAGLGLVALVAAIALRPFLENFAAGLTLQVQHPVELGDQVEIAGVEGTIGAMTARSVVVDTTYGRRVFVPNRNVLDQPITNLSRGGQRRTTVDVGLAYDTDLDAAARLMATAAAAAAGVRADPAVEVFVYEFGDSTINAAVRFWHDPGIRDGWRVRHAVALDVKRALDEAGIEIAFPQRVLWYADASG